MTKDKAVIKDKNVKLLDKTFTDTLDTTIKKDKLKKEIKVEQIELTQTSTKLEPIKIEMLKTFGKDAKDQIPDVQPKKSIINMTQGFIENLKQEGNDWIKRDGDESKRPSYEELKYLSYEQTIVWHLQATWKQRFQDRIGNLPIGLSPVIYFVIDEYGNVENIDLSQTCGNKELDQIFIKLIQETSPFPPIPKHFNEKKHRSGGHFAIVSRQFDF
ncbi:MAG: TonB C-terminal domain-containing protein [bacterium]